MNGLWQRFGRWWRGEGEPEPWRPHEEETAADRAERDPGYFTPMDWGRIKNSQGRARAIAIDARWQIERGRVQDLAEFAAKHGFDPQEIIEGVSEDILGQTYDRGYADGHEKGEKDGKQKFLGWMDRALKNT